MASYLVTQKLDVHAAFPNRHSPRTNELGIVLRCAYYTRMAYYQSYLQLSLMEMLPKVAAGFS